MIPPTKPLVNDKVVFNLKLLEGEEHTQKNFIGTINMFVDGLFLPTQISNASRLNARREITINTHKMSNPLHSEDEISLIMWGRPFARYLSSPISEGRIMQSGVPIAISLIQGDLDVILPANYNVLVKSGEFCLAGKTILARAG